MKSSVTIKFVIDRAFIKEVADNLNVSLTSNQITDILCDVGAHATHFLNEPLITSLQTLILDMGTTK